MLLSQLIVHFQKPNPNHPEFNYLVIKRESIGERLTVMKGSTLLSDEYADQLDTFIIFKGDGKRINIRYLKCYLQLKLGKQSRKWWKSLTPLDILLLEISDDLPSVEEQGKILSRKKLF